MKKVYLNVPSKDDLHYRQEWMNDPKTMNYNAGFDMNLKGYDKVTGTISKTDEEMIDWYNKWVNKEPDRYFAYIYVDGIEEPIGEVYYYPDGDIHSMGILISDKYRGKGYSYSALIELERFNLLNGLYKFLKGNIDVSLEERVNITSKSKETSKGKSFVKKINKNIIK